MALGFIQRVGSWFTKSQAVASKDKNALIDINRDQHNISRKDISPNALKVLYRLQSLGFQSYLVGGCVRDLLLDLKPKDFDVVTNATPEQVKEAFSNSRLIGRRFKLVHVTFGREIIEVATFRANHQQQHGQQQSSRSEEGMLLRDNVYGSIEEDAIRRDFTINAMYYTAKKFEIKALAQGMQDIESRQIRLIGDAETRYREDPVRMIRAIRFAVKLDFDIEQHTQAPIKELAPLLNNIPAARLFDESLKLLLNGKGEQTFDKLLHYGLFEPLFPQAFEHWQQDDSGFVQAFFRQALINTDLRINQGKSITPAFLLAVFLWPELNRLRDQLVSEGVPIVPATHQAAQKVITEQAKSASIPKRFAFTMRDIWDLQQRLPRRFGKKADQVLHLPKFRAGYDFLLLREQAGEDCQQLGQWWTEYQTLDEQKRQFMVKELEVHTESHKRRKPRVKSRRRPRRSNSENNDQTDS